MATTREIADAVKTGKKKVVTALVQEALEAGTTAAEILNEGLVTGMNELGEMFKNGEVYVPEVLVAARAMKAGTEMIKPLLQAENVQAKGVAAIGTVRGDLHDIGKNLVGMMLEGKGFTVIDLGVDVTPEMYIDAIKNQGAQIIGISALLTTTMPNMQACVEEIKKAGLRDQVRIMIGGAPVNQAFCDQIGADGYTDDAASASDMAVELVKQLG